MLYFIPTPCPTTLTVVLRKACTSSLLLDTLVRGVRRQPSPTPPPSLHDAFRSGQGKPTAGCPGCISAGEEDGRRWASQDTRTTARGLWARRCSTLHRRVGVALACHGVLEAGLIVLSTCFVAMSALPFGTYKRQICVLRQYLRRAVDSVMRDCKARAMHNNAICRCMTILNPSSWSDPRSNA